MKAGSGTRILVQRCDNGVRLVTATMPERASVTIVFMFGVGSRFERPELSGASHFVEHLLFKGTQRRPSAKEISSTVEGVGGMINASTDKEVTSYWAKVPADKVGLAVDLLSDIVRYSRLDSADVDRERQVIIEEIRMYQDIPQDYVHSLYEMLIWPDHPLGRDIAGSPESLAGQGRSELVDYIANYYSCDDLVVAMAGAIEPQQAREMVEAHLREGLARGAVAAPEIAPPVPAVPSVRVHTKPTEQAHICLGARSISYLDEDRYAVDLISAALGEGMSSRLFLEVREERGLAYDVHSWVTTHSDSGTFGVYAGVETAKAKEAVKAIVGELRRVCRGELTGSELNRAKEYSKGRLLLGLESTNAMASWLGHQELLLGRIRTVEEIVARLEAIDLGDIERVANRVLGEPLQLAAVGPFSADEGFLDLISA